MQAGRPYVIGLTGNIASGKSVIRQYLENAGAITLDTDLLAQYTYLPSGPAYQAVLDAFEPLAEQTAKGSPISRKILGRIVFKDSGSLQRLQDIIYPVLDEQLEALIKGLHRGVLVIEGVNLIEAGFLPKLDALWMTVAEDAVRLQRLVENRWMDADDAQTRIRAQTPQAEKAKHADQLIHTDGNFASSYQQVLSALAAIAVDLPPTEWEEAGTRYARLELEDYEKASELLFPDEAPSEERILELLSKRSAFFTETAEALCISSYKLDSQFAILQSNRPQHRNGISMPLILTGLEKIARQHQAKAVVVPSAMLSGAEAKAWGFLPGDTEIDGVQPEILPQVIRKYGFMPEEIYLKTLPQ